MNFNSFNLVGANMTYGAVIQQILLVGSGLEHHQCRWYSPCCSSSASWTVESTGWADGLSSLQSGTQSVQLSFSMMLAVCATKTCLTGIQQQSLTNLVTEGGVIQGVQFVGDVFANEVPEHLIEESV